MSLALILFYLLGAVALFGMVYRLRWWPGDQRVLRMLAAAIVGLLWPLELALLGVFLLLDLIVWTWRRLAARFPR